MFQHGLPLVRLETLHIAGCVMRRGDGLFQGRGVGQGDARGDLAGVLVDDVEFPLALYGDVGEVIRVALPKHGMASWVTKP